MQDVTVIEKSKLERFISKYYLGGAIPSVNWESNGTELSVGGVTQGRDLVVLVTFDEKCLPEGKYGVFDTAKLSSMLNVLGSEIKVQPTEFNDKFVSLTLIDATTNTRVDYALADESTIPRKAEVKSIAAFDVVIELDQQFITSYLRASSALSEVEHFTIMANDTSASVVIGHSTANTNKITLTPKTNTTSQISPINFSAKLFREILSANKNSTGIMKITTKGIAHISFNESGFDTNYYLVVSQAT